jgi:hypothetical protein
MCQHSEFVQGDGEFRGCLYSQCECIDFLVAIAS